MDSDDEIMSDGVSSQEEEYGGTQDSDVGSLDEGMHLESHDNPAPRYKPRARDIPRG